MRPQVLPAALRGVTFAGGVLFAVSGPLSAAQAQQCVPVGTNQTCSNSIFLSAGPTGLRDFGTLLNATNLATGTIFGTSAGIEGGVAANVVNFGIISAGTSVGGLGIDATTLKLTNYGTISAGFDAISAGNLSLYNAGQISGQNRGLGFFNGTVFNSGTISGFFGIESTNSANVTNAGTIVGSGGIAINFNSVFGAKPDTLTVLPGSHIIGRIMLRGGGDTVHLDGGNQNLTVDTLVGAHVTSMTPFAVSGTHIVSIDPTPFGLADRTLLDFTRGVSAAMPDLTTRLDQPNTGSALGFASDGGRLSPVEAVTGVPGLSSYIDDTVVFKNPVATYSEGTTLWARGFGGQRLQQADGVLLRAQSQFYGGMIGGERLMQSGVKFGAFIGGGGTHSSIDLDYGGTDSDVVFGGAFGSYALGPVFFKAMLQVGGAHTSTTRNINNNLAPNGSEIAKASYDGWYAAPELSVGRVFALGSSGNASYEVTPSVQTRYLFGSSRGYTESGSTANLSIASRSAQSFEEALQLKFTRVQTTSATSTLRTSLYGGALANQRVGGATIDATLLGNQIPFATLGRADVVGGFAGASLEFRTGRWALFASGEYISLSDSSSVASGSGGVRVAF